MESINKVINGIRMKENGSDPHYFYRVEITDADGTEVIAWFKYVSEAVDYVNTPQTYQDDGDSYVLEVIRDFTQYDLVPYSWEPEVDRDTEMLSELEKQLQSVDKVLHEFGLMWKRND